MGQVDQNSKYGERKMVFLKYANRNVLNFSLCTLFYCDIVDSLLFLNFENNWLLIQSICLRFEYHINFHWKFCKVCTSTIQRSYLSSLGYKFQCLVIDFPLTFTRKKFLLLTSSSGNPCDNNRLSFKKLCFLNKGWFLKAYFPLLKCCNYHEFTFYLLCLL